MTLTVTLTLNRDLHLEHAVRQRLAVGEARVAEVLVLEPAEQPAVVSLDDHHRLEGVRL